MVQRIRFSRTLQGALLGFALPLLLTGSGWAQSAQTSPAGPNNTGCIEKLKDKNDEEAVRCLTEAIKTEKNPSVRSKILMKIELQSEEVRLMIIKVLKDKLKIENNPNFRSNVVKFLGKIRPIEPETVEVIIDTLPEKILTEEDKDILYDATFALQNAFENIDPYKLDKAAYHLKELLDPKYDWQVQVEAAEILGSNGQYVSDALYALANLLAYKQARRNAFNALNSIAKKLKVEDIRPDKKDNAKKALDYAIKALKNYKKDLENIEQKPNNAIDGLKEIANELDDSIFNKIESWPSTKKATFGFILTLAICIIIALMSYLLFCLFPLTFLRLNQSFLSKLDAPLPGNKKIPFSWLFLSFLKYAPKVLDAWVAANIEHARNEFEKKPTVKERYNYTPVPVDMGTTKLANFTAKDLQPEFDRGQECILIWGEGGLGKTSLACQLARWAMLEEPKQPLCKKHRMLPILLEKEDFQVTEDKEVFIEAIRRSLRNLIDSQDTISEKLLEELLRRQRLLVIVDGFSEMSEDTRKQISPQLGDFPVNALVVTSRSKEELKTVNPTKLKPTKIKSG